MNYNKSLALSAGIFFVIILLFQAASPALAAPTSAGQNEQSPSSTPTPALQPSSTPEANACVFYPIAVSAQSLKGLSAGDTVNDIYNGTKPGNFGWLTWTGDQSAPALAASLTPPGNSSTYVNPNNPSDHVLSTGDWVRGKSGVSNSSSVRQALDKLKTIDIDLPVWDASTGNGSNTQYHVIAFVRVRITSYRLPGQNRISARFLGYSCESGTPTPASDVTEEPTATATDTLTSTLTPSETLIPTITQTWAPSNT